MLTLLVVLAVALVVAPSLAFAEEKEATHEGTVVKAGDGHLTITGKDNKEHTCEVAKDAKVTIDGKEAKLGDLKAGEKCTVTIVKKMATKIVVTTK